MKRTRLLLAVSALGLLATAGLAVEDDGPDIGEDPPICPADFNGDLVIDGADLAFVLNAWGEISVSPADLDGDGDVDGADLAAVLIAWGPCQ